MFILFIFYINMFIQVQTIPIRISEQHRIGYKCIHISPRFLLYFHNAGILPICNTTWKSHYYANTTSYSQWNSNSTWSQLHSKYVKSPLPTIRSTQSHSIDPTSSIVTDRFSTRLLSTTKDSLVRKKRVAIGSSSTSSNKDN